MKRERLLLGILLCAAYVLLALGVNARLFQGLDHSATTLLQAALPRALDLPSSVLSLVGSAEATLVFFAAMLLILVRRPRPQAEDPAGESSPASAGIRAGRTRSAMRWMTGPEAWLVMLFLLVGGLEIQGKLTIDQPTPPQSLRRYVFRTGMPTGDFHTANSFPSGHAARATLLMGLGVVIVSTSRAGPRTRKIAVGLLAAAWIIMLVTRVYIGDHWTSDVVGGALLAGGLLTIWAAMFRARRAATSSCRPCPRQFAALPQYPPRSSSACSSR